MTEKKTTAKTPAKKPAAKKKPAVPPPPTPPLNFADYTIKEMIVWLAVERCLPSSLPHWATGGTQFGKLYDFMEALGDAELDVPAADKCFSDWLRDETVSPNDAKYQDDYDEDDEDD